MLKIIESVYAYWTFLYVFLYYLKQFKRKKLKEEGENWKTELEEDSEPSHGGHLNQTAVLGQQLRETACTSQVWR